MVCAFTPRIKKTTCGLESRGQAGQWQWPIPGVGVNGRNSIGGSKLLFDHFVPKNCVKMKESWHPSPFAVPMVTVNPFLYWSTFSLPYNLDVSTRGGAVPSGVYLPEGLYLPARGYLNRVLPSRGCTRHTYTLGPGIPTHPLLENDTHLWKHYIPATSLTDDNYGSDNQE